MRAGADDANRPASKHPAHADRRSFRRLPSQARLRFSSFPPPQILRASFPDERCGRPGTWPSWRRLRSPQRRGNNLCKCTQKSALQTPNSGYGESLSCAEPEPAVTLIIVPTQESQTFTETRAKMLVDACDMFLPRRGLAGGHRMTLAGNFLPRSSQLPLPEDRLFRVAAEENVQILCHCHWQPERTAALTLVIVHGLEGSSSSQYVIGTANKAFAAGMNVVRMNMRNCGGTENLGPTLYHSGLSCDVASVVNRLVKDEHLPRVALAGYSMGGNLVLKCAGDWGTNAPPEVKAVCGISPAMDLAASADALHHPGNLLYEMKFLWGL